MTPADYPRGTIVRFTDDDFTRWGVVRIDYSMADRIAVQWWLAEERAWWQAGMTLPEAYEVVGLGEPELPDEVLVLSTYYHLVPEEMRDEL